MSGDANKTDVCVVWGPAENGDRSNPIPRKGVLQVTVWVRKHQTLRQQAAFQGFLLAVKRLQESFSRT
jgi:hypothetical protein